MNKKSEPSRLPRMRSSTDSGPITVNRAQQTFIHVASYTKHTKMFFRVPSTIH